MLDEIQKFYDRDLICIRGLTFSFNSIVSPDVPLGPPWFELSGDMQPSSPVSLSYYWFISQTLYYNQYIIVDNGEPGLVDSDFLFRWFGQSIGAFLQTPIFGNFSIGGLVFTVICIGLCVLLAKILS